MRKCKNLTKYAIERKEGTFICGQRRKGAGPEPTPGQRTFTFLSSRIELDNDGETTWREKMNKSWFSRGQTNGSF